MSCVIDELINIEKNTNQMSDENFDNYAQHLKRRSLVGGIYRNFYLYPRLSKYLNGVCIDIGCGIGDFLDFKSGATGYDINPLNIEFCKKRGLNAEIMQPESLPIESELVDSVIMDNVLEHIENPKELLKEIRRVLKQNGLFMIGVPGIIGYRSDSDHKVFYDESTLIKLAESTGFKVERNIYLPLFKSEFLSKNLKQYCLYSIWRPVN